MYTVFIFAIFLLFLSFDFVKSSGTSVVAINLPEQHKMNGKVLKHSAPFCHAMSLVNNSALLLFHPSHFHSINNKFNPL
jgi:hypothetical protein